MLSPSERYGLVDDTWSSVLAGETDAETHLSLVTSLASKLISLYGNAYSPHLNTSIQLPTNKVVRAASAHPRLVDNLRRVLGLEPIDNEPDLDRSYEPYYFPRQEQQVQITQFESC